MSATNPSTYATLGAEHRYEKLDADLTPSDIPDFRANHTHDNGFVDKEACVKEMRTWLNERINAGESASPYTNDTYQSISVRPDIRHYDYRDSPVLPHPKTMEGDGASCVRVSLKGTVDPETRYDDPQPKTEAHQHLWNVVMLFAHATGAEIRLQYSQLPKDDLNAYLFYDFSPNNR